MNDSARQATRIDDIQGRLDPWLLAVVLALASLGLVMVGSSSISQHPDPFHYLIRHLVFLAGGLVLAVWATRVELRTVERYNQLMLLGCFVLLLMVFVPGLGVSVKGAHRWINVGVSNFQVVEAVKVLFIIWLASYLVRFRDEVNATWGAMLKPIAVVLLLVGLLLMQPDFGSASLLLAITAGLLVLGGVNMPRMFLPVLILLPTLAFVAVLEPYRMRRLTSFMDPWSDPFNSGYQLTNALMAAGRGEWLGVGLGSSIQKLSYLPEAHTDFILAVIAEELGFIGVCAVIGLFALLVGRAFWIGLQCVEMRRHFSAYLAFGIGLWIGLQSFVSIGVNLGLLPTKGLTLPLISSGGSSVLMTCAAMGLLLRVSYELERARRQMAHLRGDAGREDVGADAALSAGGKSRHAAGPATASAPKPPAATPVLARKRAGAGRGTSRLQQRIEPTLGGMA